MKHGHALAIGTLALALAACGGHGSKGGGGTNPGDNAVVDPIVTTPSAAYHIEAVVVNSPVVDNGYVFQDPLNIQVLDRLQFQLVSYSATGTRTVVATVADSGGLGGVTFTTSDTRKSELAGALSTSDGNYSAPSSDSGNTRYTITASYQGSNYSTQYRINPRLNQVRIRGAVVQAPADGATTYQGVQNAEIDFYEPRTPSASDPSDPNDFTNDRQIIVQRVLTASDGTFRASVPATVDKNGNPTQIRFVVIPPDGYNTTFGYGGTSADAYSSIVTTSNDISGLPALSGVLEGNFYLVGAGDIVKNSLYDSTFQLSNADPTVLANDVSNLITLSPATTTTTSLKARAAAKAR